MKLRVLAVTGLLLVLAPAAASADTTAVYNGGAQSLTLTNDGDAERFTAALDEDSDPEYVITAQVGTIDDPVVAGCTRSNGNRTLSCTAAAGVEELNLLGGAGDDSVTISGSLDYQFFGTGLEVDGGADDDTFTAGDGARLSSDAIEGGPGNDRFIGSDEFGDSFHAEAGNDTYRGGTAPLIPGLDPDGFQRFQASDRWSPSSDTEPVNISLDGVANDTDGVGGTDDIAEIERIRTADGNDTLTAGATGVDFDGGGGDDVLTGSPEGDALDGESGNDTLRAGGGDDSLYDGDYESPFAFADDPPPPAGNDTLDGGEGNDWMSWGAGKDDLVGGPGTDTASTVRYAVQTFPTQPPPDDAQPREQALTISLNDQPDDGPTGGSEGDNVHGDVEDLEVGGGSRGIMVLARSSRIASEIPLPAGHTITGSAAANTITTGDGPDTIDPGAGADVVSAFGGDDRITAVDTVTDVIACGRGNDTVGADLPGTNAPRADVLTDCEAVSGTPLGLEGGALPVAPAVTLGGAGTYKVKKFLRSYTVTADVTSDQEATVAGELSVAGARIAKVGALTIGSGRLKAGTGKRKLKVKVAVRYRKALKRKLRTRKQRRRGVKLTLSVAVKNAAGQVTTKRKTIRVKG